MDPDRKRKIRLVVALSAAVILAVALIYTSFSASNDAVEPSELLAAAAGNPGQTFDLTGKVVDGSVDRAGNELAFEIGDRDDPDASAIPVAYSGTIPDPFREGREVIITGALVDGTFVAEKDSLITKCPSKFSEQAETDDQIMITTTPSS